MSEKAKFGVPEVKDRVLDDILLCSQEASILDHALALMIHADSESKEPASAG